MNVNEFLSHFEKVRKMGTGWQTNCPAHEDRTPSLSIGVADDGRILVKCHAGCRTEDVLAAVRLTMRDLMPDDTVNDDRFAARRRPAATAAKPSAKPPRVFGAMKCAINEYDRMYGRHTAMWPYEDAGGAIVGAVLRWDKDCGGKDVRPIALTDEGWALKAMEGPRPLYRLGELAQRRSDRVYVAEGEKAADAARSLGLLATTSAGGSNAASKTDWQPLAGRDVVLLPDNDDAGQRYADDVLARLHALGPVAMVRLVELPHIPSGGDIVEFIASRRGAGLTDEAIRAEIESLADTADLEPIVAAESAVPEYEPFPVDVFFGAVREFVRKAATSIGCDVAFVALPILSALASAIGNSRRLQLKPGWTEPCIVWTTFIGESGSHKSPALQEAMRPTRRRQHEAMKRYAYELEQYQRDNDAYERDLKVWKAKGKDAPPPEPPIEPVADRCWTDDVTIEALVKLLSMQPRGLLLVRDELAGWLEGFDRYNQGGEVAKWLEMHGGREVMVDRKTSGTIYVPRAAVSVAGGIQPEILRRALCSQYRENGLAARLLLAYPPRRPRRWTESELPASVQLALNTVFESLYGLDPGEDELGDPQPIVMQLDSEAKTIWIEFFNEHGHEQADLGGDLAAAWSKLEGYAARFAMILHLTRWACGDRAVVDREVVDAASMEAGIALARWFGREAKRVYAILNEDEEQAAQRRLIDLIARRGGSITARELMRASRPHSKCVEGAETALDHLVEAGYGQWRHEATKRQGGRQVRRFWLNRMASTDATPVPERSGEGSVSVDVSAAESEEVGVA